MRKEMIVGIVSLILFCAPVAVLSQSMNGKRHGMMDEPTLGQMGGSADKQGSLTMPCGGMPGDCATGGPMMGYGMMDGYGMMHGPGMMQGPGMMNHPMMGGYGMGMHGWYGDNDWSSEKMRSFLDRTRDLRKQIHDLRFEYGEKMRNPDTTVGELQEMRDKLMGLQKQLWEEYGK